MTQRDPATVIRLRQTRTKASLVLTAGPRRVNPRQCAYLNGM
jgi:hypothetical protein